MEIISITGMIFLIFFLGVSIWANVFLVRRLLFFSESVETLLLSLTAFQEHLAKINSMETYYGDEILASLSEHSTEVITDLGNFRDAYEREAAVNEKRKTPAIS
jgi:hypothetical protein